MRIEQRSIVTVNRGHVLYCTLTRETRKIFTLSFGKNVTDFGIMRTNYINVSYDLVE